MLNPGLPRPADFSVLINGAVCSIQDVSSDSTLTNDVITCRTPPLPPGTSTLILTINGQTASSTITVAASAPNITGVTPNDPSPVIKRKLIISVDPTYPGDLEADFASSLLQVNLIDKTGSRPDKAYRVVAASNADSTVTFLFGGHYSGLYDLILFHFDDGNFGGDV